MGVHGVEWFTDYLSQRVLHVKAQNKLVKGGVQCTPGQCLGTINVSCLH